MINYNRDAIDSTIIFAFLHSKYVIGNILKKILESETSDFVFM